MSWSRIIGHDRIKNILQRAILENRIPSAYLLWGLEGIGKEAIAIQFAKTVNCERPLKSSDSIDSCGVCRSCKQFESLSHPNFYIVHSLPPGKTTDSRSNDPYASLSEDQMQEIKEQTILKSQDHYYKISLPKAKQIKVPAIRKINKELSLTAGTSGRRVVMISNADEMTLEAANAFLKNLEEPSANVTIILVTSRKDNILPTILSRCQQLQCSQLSDDEIKKALISKYGLNEEKASLAATLGQGSVKQALDSVSEDMKEFRDTMINSLRAVFKRKEYRLELNDQIENLIKSKDPHLQKKFLLFMVAWFRDAYLLSKNGDETKVVNQDKIDTLSKFANHYGTRNLPEVIDEIERSYNMISGNIAPELIFLSLFSRIRQIFLA